MNLPRNTSIDASAVRRSVRERSSSSASRFPSLPFPPVRSPPFFPFCLSPVPGVFSSLSGRRSISFLAGYPDLERLVERQTGLSETLFHLPYLAPPSLPLPSEHTPIHRRINDRFSRLFPYSGAHVSLQPSTQHNTLHHGRSLVHPYIPEHVVVQNTLPFKHQHRGQPEQYECRYNCGRKTRPNGPYNGQQHGVATEVAVAHFKPTDRLQWNKKQQQ